MDTQHSSHPDDLPASRGKLPTLPESLEKLMHCPVSTQMICCCTGLLKGEGSDLVEDGHLEMLPPPSRASEPFWKTRNARLLFAFCGIQVALPSHLSAVMSLISLAGKLRDLGSYARAGRTMCRTQNAAESGIGKFWSAVSEPCSA